STGATLASPPPVSGNCSDTHLDPPHHPHPDSDTRDRVRGGIRGGQLDLPHPSRRRATGVPADDRRVGRVPASRYRRGGSPPAVPVLARSHPRRCSGPHAVPPRAAPDETGLQTVRDFSPVESASRRWGSPCSLPAPLSAPRNGLRRAAYSA